MSKKIKVLNLYACLGGNRLSWLTFRSLPSWQDFGAINCQLTTNDDASTNVQ